MLSQRKPCAGRGEAVELRTDCNGADAHPLAAKSSKKRRAMITAAAFAFPRNCQCALQGWTDGSRTRRQMVRGQETRTKPSSGACRAVATTRRPLSEIG